MSEPITLSDCRIYLEDPCICDDIGEPKGQCVHCGAKWYEHAIDALPTVEQESARQIQAERGLMPKPVTVMSVATWLTRFGK